MSLFLDSTPNPIIILGNDKRVKFVNKHFLNLVSKNREDIMGKKCDFSSLLVHDNNYIHKEEDLIVDKANKIAIVTEHGKNIFLLYYTQINDVNGISLKMYTLNNITKN